MIFKSADPKTALEKTRRKLADVEANIAGLMTKRAETLLSAEDAGAVVSIDLVRAQRQRGVLHAFADRGPCQPGSRQR